MAGTPSPGPGSRSIQLLRGTLDVLILKTLARQGELHGYGIVAQLEAVTNGALMVDDGALYQSLHRMQEREWVESEWGHVENGKRAKFYRLTAEGRRRLRTETREWVRYAEVVFRVLDPEAAT
ncbi:MAG TPA: PadR family transcriptional regulator [Longimicrobiales bacterium]